MQDKESNPAFNVQKASDKGSSRSKVSGLTNNSKQNISSLANLAKRISLKKNPIKDNLEQGKWIWSSK